MTCCRIRTVCSLTGRIESGSGWTQNDLVLCRDHNQWQPYRISSHQSEIVYQQFAGGRAGQDGIWSGLGQREVYSNSRAAKFKPSTPAAACPTISPNHCWSITTAVCGSARTAEISNRLQSKNLFSLGRREGRPRLRRGCKALAEVSPAGIYLGRKKRATDLYAEIEGGNFHRLAATGLSLCGPQINSLLIAADGSCWLAARARTCLRISKDPKSIEADHVSY